MAYQNSSHDQSEYQAQRELNLPRAGAAVLHTRRDDLAERGTGSSHARVVEVRMVERVEDLGSELQVALFLTQRESLQHREIESVRGRPDDDVASGRAVAPERAVGAARGVEPPRRVVREVVGIASDVGPRPGLRAGKLQAGGRAERVAGLDGDDSVGLPSAEDGVHHPGAR